MSAQVLPIAHRGACAYAPENSLSAIKKAIELGSKYIEIDVHMTKDGEIVSIHDSTIDRTSNGSGKVFDFNLSDLNKYDYGKWFSDKFKDEKLPTLSEVLDLTGKENILIIELKYGGNDYPEVEKKIISMIKEKKLEKSVILKSFSYKVLNTFESLAPEIDRLYCTFGGASWVTLDNFLRFKSIFEGSNFKYLQVHKYFLSKSLIKKAHKKGIKIIVWDVHDKESMHKFKKMGVDFIESDHPDYVLNI